jgi:hypothetical protein
VSKESSEGHTHKLNLHYRESKGPSDGLHTLPLPGYGLVYTSLLIAKTACSLLKTSHLPAITAI